MKMKDLCEADRPREKMFASGPESLSNAELLAVLLRCGTQSRSALEIGQEMMVEAGGRLSELFSMSLQRLCSVNGIKKGKAACIAAALELGRRFFNEQGQIPKRIDSSDTAWKILYADMKGLPREELWILYLNRNCRLIGKEKVSSGSDYSTALDIKAVTQKCLEHKASNVIIAHNHPSGNPKPSEADIERTKALRLALSTFEIALVDSLIICDGSWFSFAESAIRNNPCGMAVSNVR